jgi:hypothetical protein
MENYFCPAVMLEIELKNKVLSSQKVLNQIKFPPPPPTLLIEALK